MRVMHIARRRYRFDGADTERDFVVATLLVKGTGGNVAIYAAAVAIGNEDEVFFVTECPQANSDVALYDLRHLMEEQGWFPALQDAPGGETGAQGKSLGPKVSSLHMVPKEDESGVPGGSHVPLAETFDPGPQEQRFAALEKTIAKCNAAQTRIYAGMALHFEGLKKLLEEARECETPTLQGDAWPKIVWFKTNKVDAMILRNADVAIDRLGYVIKDRDGWHGRFASDELMAEATVYEDA